MNPYLPLNVHIPDGEPHVFGNRVYIYGSRDALFGTHYCPLDYEVYSADINDLSNWRHDGVSFRKTDDPSNTDGKHFLYAPDVVKGNDGRYYLYYFLESTDAICVAVSDKPEGPFSYHGVVKYCVDRNTLKDYPSSFDPAVINDDGRIYLAWGFSVDFRIEGMALNDDNTKGAYIVELEDDMLTMKSTPTFIVPGYKWGKGTSFEGHEFLEASSLRKFNDTYYFIYSSQAQHELCYATSKSILGPYTYRGVLVSNAYEGKLKNNWANNHGSIEKIGDSYYIFYHRHSCGTQFSRQGCVEKIELVNDEFQQAPITSQGFDGKLKTGIYPAGRACYVWDKEEGIFLGFDEKPNDVARIVEDKIENITDSTVVFRYFERVNSITLSIEQASQGTVELFMNNKLIGTKSISESIHFDCEQTDTDITLHFNCDKPITLLAIKVQ